MNSKELIEREGKKVTLSLYNDAKDLLERLPDKLSIAVYTASMRDFLWGVVDQFDHIAAQDAAIAELETQLRGATIMFSDNADTITTLRADLAKAVEGRDAMRQQGQGEGFAEAVQQLRDMSAQKPLNALAAPAAVLANRLERSRSAAQSLIKELRS